MASAGGKPAGVLHIPVSATQKGNPAPAPAKSAAKPPAPRLKLIVRRLPPGLTQAEFETNLGDDWKVGSGQVDWFQYKPGKVSKDPAKPSRPARAYLHLLSETLIPSLFEKVKNTSFNDARSTSNDPVLMGPPSVEFAPYARVPGSRTRKDGRQGAIDQDPDFVAFLESLTNPVKKPAAAEGEAEKDDDQITVTPLVQYIKEKKASKAKDGASGKSSKRGKDKEAKAEKAEAKKLLKRPEKESTLASAPGSPDKKSTSSPAKVEKATKEAVKAANKQAAAAAASAKSKQSGTKESSQASPTRAPASDRKRERGDVTAAAKILQRDLGLAPSGGRRRGKAAAAAADNEGAKKEAGQDSASSSPTVPTGPKGSKQGPKVAKESASKGAAPKGGPSQVAQATETNSNTDNAATGSTAATPKPPKQPKPKQPAVSPTATQAFLKHANPSQGVTEELLDAAFGVFGKVTKVEIDRKKGFGYVDFAEADGLHKAIAASPVAVAQSQVVVLERKNPPSQQKAGKTGDAVAPQASAAATPQSGVSREKRSRGTRSRGGRGQKKAGAGTGGAEGEKAEKATCVSEAQ